MCAGIAAAAAADSSVERVRRQFIEYYAMRELPMPQAEKYLLPKPIAMYWLTLNTFLMKYTQ